jgi:uncharacterized protein YbjQ (UPF0145 family)
MPSTRKLRGGSPSKSINIYPTSQIVLGDNTDPDYKQVGIIHITETTSANILRQYFTGVANIFGHKGFDLKIYDAVRMGALKKLEDQLKSTQKVCNMRMDFENKAADAILVHCYGTLYEKM